MAGIAQEETPTQKMYTFSSKLATSGPPGDHIECHTESRHKANAKSTPFTQFRLFKSSTGCPKKCEK